MIEQTFEINKRTPMRVVLPTAETPAVKVRKLTLPERILTKHAKCVKAKLDQKWIDLAASLLAE